MVDPCSVQEGLLPGLLEVQMEEGLLEVHLEEARVGVWDC
jgi:hypothetical protein